LRRLISIVLLAVLGLPFASSLFALTPKSEANLPACCRRNGKHHCMMSMAERERLSEKPQFSPVPERCPYAPAVVAVGWKPHALVLSLAALGCVAWRTQSMACGKDESHVCTRFRRSHRLRGPPVSHTLSSNPPRLAKTFSC
jgi:hypothetical protein